jgi:RHS repeat-associated protein
VLVTDQAGKQRISKSDGLGRLTDVWEIRTADSVTGTEAVTFPNHSEVTAGYRTKYSYDALDDLTQVTQQVGTTGTTQTRTFSYDGLKRLTSAFNPESGTITYGYDNNSNLLTKTDSRVPAVTTTYSYDALNRVNSRTHSDGTPAVAYKYDAQSLPANYPPSFNRGSSTGRLVAVNYGGTSAGNYNGYDLLGRVTSSDQQTDSQNYGFSYGYNLAGAMTSETYPSGRQITTAYDAAGRISTINGQKTGESNKTYASQFSYAAHGAAKSLQLGNSKWEHTNFNSRLQPSQIGLGTSATNSSILQLDYGYGATNANNGNVLTQTITIGATIISQNYGYDALNRLSSASEGPAWSQTYDCDRFGNRAVRIGSYIPQPQLTPQSSSPTDFSAFNQSNNRIQLSGFGYDTAGNLTADPTTAANAMVYDAENRQVSYTKAGVTTTYSYDGDGRRVKKVDSTGTIIFVYNVGGQLIAEYHNDPVPPPAGGGGTSYLTSDHLGSTRVVTKSDGTVKARYDYLPFGEELGATIGQRTTGMGYSLPDSTKQKFTQKERDNESGLDYFLARYYSSAQGRFTSPDEFAGGPDDVFILGSGHPQKQALYYADITNPQSLNKYQYSFNNPLRYVDPDGHDPDDDEKKEEKRLDAEKESIVKIGFSAIFGPIGIAFKLLVDPPGAGDDSEPPTLRELVKSESKEAAMGLILPKGLRSTRLFSGLTSKLESGLSKAIGREVSVGSGHVTRRVIERMFTEGGALAGVSVKQLGKTLNKGEFYKDAVTGSFIAVRKNVAIAFVVEKSKVIIKTVENAGNIKEGERFTRVARPF